MSEENPLSNFFEKLLGMAIMARLPQEDHGPKEVGDKVILLDIHNMRYVCEFESGKPIKDKNEDGEVSDEAMIIFAQGYIVIETDIKHTYRCQYCPNEHNCDTIVYSPDDEKKYYVNASDIKVVE